MFNIILRDGTRSTYSMTWSDGKLHDRYDYFIPKNNKITKVTIYYSDFINGFRFHLGDGSDWDIGYIEGATETIDLADNEVIVGFKSKSHFTSQAYYVEW